MKPFIEALPPIIVFIGIPIVYSIIASRIMVRSGAKKLWEVGVILMLASMVYSFLNPSTTLRYASPKDAGGIRSIHFLYSFLCMTFVTYFCYRLNIHRAAILSLTVVAGIMVLVIGCWVA